MPDANVIQMHILIHYNRNVIPVPLSSFREILKFSSFLIPELQRSICFIYFSERNLSALLVAMMTFKYDKEQIF